MKAHVTTKLISVECLVSRICEQTKGGAVVHVQCIDNDVLIGLGYQHNDMSLSTTAQIFRREDLLEFANFLIDLAGHLQK